MPSFVEIDTVVLEIFLNFINDSIISISLFCLRLENGMVFYLNKFEFPLLKNALYQVWLKLSFKLRRAKIVIRVAWHSLVADPQ